MSTIEPAVIGKPVNLTYRRAKQVVVFVIGATLLLLGALLLVLPGPGSLIMLAGMGVLATEFVWARRFLRKVNRQLDPLKHRLEPMTRGSLRWWRRWRAGRIQAPDPSGVRGSPDDAN